MISMAATIPGTFDVFDVFLNYEKTGALLGFGETGSGVGSGRGGLKRKK